MIVYLNYSCNSLQLILTFGTAPTNTNVLLWLFIDLKSGINDPVWSFIGLNGFCLFSKESTLPDHIWMVVNLNLWSNSFNESIVLFLRSNLSRISVDNRLIIVSNIQHLLQHNL